MEPNCDEDEQVLCSSTFNSDQDSQTAKNIEKFTLNYHHLIIAGLFLIILVCPWLFFLNLLGIVLGFSSLEFLDKKLKPLIIEKFLLNNSSKIPAYDPLLHPSPLSTRTSPSSNSISSTCSVCEDENCLREDISSSSSSKRRTSQTVSSISSSVHGGIHFHHDLQIDSRLDLALAKFFSAIFDAYVNPIWAPYLTRNELKRALVQILTSFGQDVKDTFLTNDSTLKMFAKRQVIPLLYVYLSKIQNQKMENHETAVKLDFAHRKIIRLTKLMLRKYLPKDSYKCHLWNELCLSILVDGVFWNLLELGRREIPLLVETILTSMNSSIRTNSNRNYAENSHAQNETDQSSQFPTEEQIFSSDVTVSLLLDSFLDPCHDVEQPPQIVSRYRPTLDYILSESDLLYCLIHFLKDRGDLELLQAVLEEECEESQKTKESKKSFPRKALELKHLSHFSRSRQFLETLGFEQIEPAVEAETDSHLFAGKQVSQHTRSASYGGAVTGGLWEQNVVDGFTIYPASNQPSSIPTNNTTGPTSPTESDSFFRRRHTLEPFIAKFYASLIRRKDHETTEPESFPTKRVGIRSKSYEKECFEKILIDDNHYCDELLIVSSKIRKGFLLKNFSEHVIKMACLVTVFVVFQFMRDDLIWSSSLFGWINFLHPFLEAKFEKIADEFIENIFSVNNLCEFIHFATDAFTGSLPSENHLKQDIFLKISPFLPILNRLFNKEYICNQFFENSEEILLFFVDLFDIIVSLLLNEKH